jgi:glyoxylase I family protein
VERVTGIGGVFVRASDPEALTRWYAIHLGVDPPPPSYDEQEWWQEAGPTVFAPMGADEEDSPHFGRPGQHWAINFRVRDLDAMAEQLTAAGIEVDVDPATYPNGRFASIHDPEGNPVQLWEPVVGDDW